jgi:hypothetical protein
VDHALGNALVVEVGHLLAEVEVLHQRRPALARGEAVVGVADLDPLVGGQRLVDGLLPMFFKLLVCLQMTLDRCDRRTRPDLAPFSSPHWPRAQAA